MTRTLRNYLTHRAERRIKRALADAYDRAGHLPRTRRAIAEALTALRVELSARAAQTQEIA